jgi:hypothetical protein
MGLPPLREDRALLPRSVQRSFVRDSTASILALAPCFKPLKFLQVFFKKNFAYVLNPLFLQPDFKHRELGKFLLSSVG